MISTEEAAARLGISRRRVQDLIKNGALKAEKVSRVWLVDEFSVDSRLRSVSKKGGRPSFGEGRNETSFLFMNRAHEVAKVVYDAAKKEFVHVSEFDERYAPLGLASSSGSISLLSFNRWWRGRGIPETREGLASLLDEAGVGLPEELLQRNLGLSLSDQYWICPVASGLQWADVNFFNNDFGKVSLSTSSFVADGGAAVAKPDNTSDGNLRKTWVCRNGVRFLLKSGTKYGQEPYNEVVASALHRRLLKPDEFVPYTLEGEGPLARSCCPNFLTDEEEFVPAVYVERCCEKSPNKNEYEHYLSCCDELGAKGAKLLLDRMIVCDDLIANHDRHHRNFGIIRNIETLECRPAPIFDSGSSLWCDVETSQLARGEHSFTGKQFYANPAKQMLLVEDMGWFNAKSLEDFADEAAEVLSKNEALLSRVPYVVSALKWRLGRMIAIAEWA